MRMFAICCLLKQDKPLPGVEQRTVLSDQYACLPIPGFNKASLRCLVQLA